jgi:hypothetical protein
LALCSLVVALPGAEEMFFPCVGVNIKGYFQNALQSKLGLFIQPGGYKMARL